MASLVYDRRRHCWRVKWYPGGPKTPRVEVNLGPHDGARPEPGSRPKAPPWATAELARYEQKERDLRSGRTRPTPGPRDLAEYCEQYCRVHATRRKARSTALLRRAVGSFAAFAAARGATTVQAVTPEVCRDWLAERRAGGWAPATARAARAYVAAIWRQAIRDGLVATSPWAEERVALPVRKTPKAWTAEELARVVAACRTPRTRDAVLVLANTGMRLGTALLMRWRWIDWGARLIRIEPGEGIKTAYDLAIPDGALDVLQRLAAARDAGGPDDPVFRTSKGRPIHPTYMFRRIQGAVRRAGVPAFGPHSLRHTCAVLMLRSGVPIHAVQAQLGHASLAQTAVYLRCLPAEEERVLSFRVGGPPAPPG